MKAGREARTNLLLTGFCQRPRLEDFSHHTTLTLTLMAFCFKITELEKNVHRRWMTGQNVLVHENSGQNILAQHRGMWILGGKSWTLSGQTPVCTFAGSNHRFDIIITSGWSQFQILDKILTPVEALGAPSDPSRLLSSDPMRPS